MQFFTVWINCPYKSWTKGINACGVDELGNFYQFPPVNRISHAKSLDKNDADDNFVLSTLDIYQQPFINSTFINFLRL